MGLAFLFALGTPACGADAPAPLERVAAAESAIAGGKIDATDTAVVGVFDMNAGAMCSGSLIAPNLVLTAHHCVAPILDEVGGGVSCTKTRFGKEHSAGSFLVTTKKAFTMKEADYHHVAKVVVAPAPAPSLVCGNDAAVLILDENVAPGEAVPIVPRVDTSIAKGDGYGAVGYGATDDAGDGSGTRRRRDGLVVSCVGAKCPASYVKKTEWIGDKGICSGDSGGPALDLQGRVVGITSRGSAGCEDPIYTHVLALADWIKAMASEAAKAGGYEAPPWSTGWPTDPAYSSPIGGACATNDDCPSKNCVQDEADGAYCTRPCSEAAPCPDGYRCDEGSTTCVRVPPPVEDTPPDGAGGGEPAAGGGAAGGAASTSTPASRSDAATDSAGGCAIAAAPDLTKPDPWLHLAGLGALALLLRRTRRKPSKLE